jgi:Ala-tRNA(Pro) deacylase
MDGEDRVTACAERRKAMDVVKFLKSNRVKFELRHHPARFTAQEVAAAEHITGEEVAKVVIVKAGSGFVLCVLPATYVLDMAGVKSALGTRDVRLATEEEIAGLFPDCEVGAMPPFGAEYGLDTYADEHLAADEEILVPAGSHEDAVLMPWKDFERLAKPKVASFAVHMH